MVGHSRTPRRASAPTLASANWASDGASERGFGNADRDLGPGSGRAGGGEGVLRVQESRQRRSPLGVSKLHETIGLLGRADADPRGVKLPARGVAIDPRRDDLDFYCPT